MSFEYVNTECNEKSKLVNSTELKLLVDENEKIYKEQKYVNSHGNNVEIKFCGQTQTKFIPETMKLLPPKSIPECKTIFKIFPLPTVEAALLMGSSIKDGKKLILNFASAKHPGGGYNSGAQAQEEANCRASLLYYSLVTKEASFYQEHVAMKSTSYSDAIIYSTNVPFFRNSNHQLLDAPIYLDVISCAAINQSKGKIKNAAKIMQQRIERILEIALVAKATHLILGAFGTGVFKNPVEMIADIFHTCLKCKFKDMFQEVWFAILPEPSHHLETFQYIFRKDIQKDNQKVS